MYYMGVDISKEKVDIALLDSNYKLLLEKVVKNNEVSLTKFINLLLKKFKIQKEELLVCCEETGIYKRPLQMTCITNQIPLWVELALKIKRASVAMRGKSDKQDAIRIADYARRYSDKQVLYKEPGEKNKKLHTLLNARETVIDQKIRFAQQLNESKRFDKEKYEVLKSCFQKPLSALKKQLALIEDQIEELVENCPEMNRTAQLLKSIPGIGLQTALQFIVYTQNFTMFNSANHLACYAGVAPFPNESGTIIKKARVSNLANKKLKRLLHLAAMASVRSKGEIKAYYIRKVQEGKNKMLVLNNVRNKLVKRMFAVIKRQSEYVSINFETNTCLLT